MKMVVEESIAMNAFRAFFSIIDNFIYGMIASCYEFIDAIAGARMADGAVDAISDRVYAFLSIFMLFKVSFSFINYLINPDSFTDKNNGAQKIVLNIVVMFLMLIVNPWAFDKIYEVQNLFLKEGIVENIVFGTTNVDGENMKTFQMSSDCDDVYAQIDINRYKGDYVSLLLFKPFYQSIDLSDDDLKDRYCRDDSGGELHVSDYLKSSVYNAEDDTYLVSYVFLASTAVGVLALLILLSMLLDVALRAVKLMFLQIIAPIPIISYIDPKSGKDGIFKKWLREVGSTWISLFVRLFCFNFSILLIQLMTTGQILGIKEDYAGKIFVDLILIIGALMFVKKLPDIISNIFGIKMGGGFNINPLKKISNEAIGGKYIAGGAMGIATAGASGTGQLLSNAYNHVKTKNNLKKAEAKEQDPDKKAALRREIDSMGTRRFLATTAGGAIGGVRRGLMSGFKDGANGNYSVLNVVKNASSDVVDGNRARNNRTNVRNYNREVDVKYENELKQFFEEKGVTRVSDLDEDGKKEYKKMRDEYKEQYYGFFERNIGEALDQRAGVKNEYGGHGYYDKKINDLSRKISDAESDEAAMRTALANYCVNESISLEAMKEFHKDMKKTTEMVENKYEELKKEKYEEKYNTTITRELNNRVNDFISSEDYNNKFNEKFAAEKNRLVQENNRTLTTEEYTNLKNAIEVSLKKEAEENIKLTIQREVELDLKEEAKVQTSQVIEERMKNKYGDSVDTLKQQYEKVNVQLNNIDKIDERSKQLRGEKRSYEAMLSARKQVDKKG